ncbi:hypothetical protein GOBAR_AA21897 [Gossypium barbadense]|uniref:Uncharacterized protein n=1 Tax=Gossypium barbadense TaxID=3634 RepID=A0A2P5X619_GOSBA|nr:hypothetical protein GOBAR_AA21897 [Gossypium barbadense]
MTGSLPSNIEPNPREQLNVINVQNEEGFVELEPEPRQETVMPNAMEFLKELLANKRKLDEELDEWQKHKPRTHDKPKLRQNELDTFSNQLKVSDKVLLDAADPHIVTTRSDE